MSHSRYWLLLVVVVLVGCGPALQREDIEGIWILETFETDGTQHVLEVGANAAEQAWVEITDELRGNFGCNAFNTFTPNTYEETRLVPGEIMMNAMYCGMEEAGLMQAEEAFAETFRNRPIGIEVELEDDQMIWSARSIRLVFRASPTAPER